MIEMEERLDIESTPEDLEELWDELPQSVRERDDLAKKVTTTEPGYPAEPFTILLSLILIGEAVSTVRELLFRRADRHRDEARRFWLRDSEGNRREITKDDLEQRLEELERKSKEP